MVMPIEYLNSLQPQGLPAHNLTLKVGMPIMSLRNMSRSLGIANGTRLLITALRRHSIEASIMTGHRAGSQVLLPRIMMPSSDKALPFTLCRLQFPIRPAFALTVNKSQGQTFGRVGIYLPNPVFSHGQLYVALSRVGEPQGVTVMLAHDTPEDCPDDDSNAWTVNEVYTEALPPDVA